MAAIGFAMLLCLPEPPADANDDTHNWPRFRGPESMPVADHPNLPERWSTTENVEWVTEVPGVGWSSPIVWDGKIFLTAATSEQAMKQPSLGTDFSNEYVAELRAEGLSSEEANARLYARDREMPHEIVIRLMLYCYELETGKLLWERQVYHGNPPGGRHRKNSFASETPVTDGERVYVYFGHLGLYAYDFEGLEVWATPLKLYQKVRDFGDRGLSRFAREQRFRLERQRGPRLHRRLRQAHRKGALAYGSGRRSAKEDRLGDPFRLGERATHRAP